MRRTGRNALILVVLLAANGARAETVVVDSKEALVKAAQAAQPGDVIRIKAGTYPGGVHLSGVRGTVEQRIVIESAGLDRAKFSGEKGGRSAIHLSGCSHLTLRSLVVTDFPINGINADDGGKSESPAVGLQFDSLSFANIGPRGNHDALKLSGLKEFSVRECFFLGWGGSAIDMVGCHDGTIEDCSFVGEPECSQASGVQMKGGSSRILVKRSNFVDAGQRAINLGGGTGLAYFRPPDAIWEASDIEVMDCVFRGSLTPVAWVGIDGGYIHHNTIYKPEKWVARILQENTDPRFERCRNGRFESNLVVFDNRVQVFVNVGGNTEPDSFTFRDNAWFDVDDPQRGPRLPVEEHGSVVGVDPEFGDLKDLAMDGFTVGSKNERLKGIGVRFVQAPRR